MTAAEPKYFKQILFIYVLFVVTVLVHFPVLLNGIINWKDDELFLSLHSLSGNILSVTQQDAHSPAMMLWYRLQFAVGKDGHFLYHAVSLLLHTANAILLYLLLLRFRWSAVMSAAAVLLFAVHPVHVESVAMISGQPTLLTLFFLLLFVRWYHAFLSTGGRASYVAAMSAAAAIAAVGYPTVLPIIAAALLHWSADRRMTKVTVIPLLVLWGATVLPLAVNGPFFDRVWPMVSGSVLMVRYGIAEQALRIFVPWNADLLVPTVTMVYPVIQGNFILPFIVITATAAAFALRHRHPALFIAASIILAGSLPLTSGVVRGEWLFSDDGSYLPALGWIIASVAAAELIVRRWVTVRTVRFAVWVAAVTVIIPLTALTAFRTAYWESGQKFWEHALQEQPSNIFALIKKGMYHYFRYEIEPSLKALDRAVELAPNDYEVWYSRGVVNLGAMNLPQATGDYTTALRLDSTSSNAYFGLGSIHALYSRHDSAVIAFSHAIRFSSNFFEAYSERAVAYGALRRYSEAMADFRAAISIAPAYGKAYGDRGVLWLQIGNAQEAAADFGRQATIEPRNIAAIMNSAMASVLIEDTTSAELQFSKAMAIDSLRANLYLMAAGKSILRTPDEKALGEHVFRRSKFGKF